MKEGFSELYARLYNENFLELEALRKKEEKQSLTLISIIIGMFFLMIISPSFLFVGFIALIIYIIKLTKKTNNAKSQPSEPKEKSYREVFKEKIIGPIIENSFEGAKYDSYKGFSSIEYRKMEFRDYYDRFRSDDMVIAPLKMKEDVTTFITFSEVHTERESRDKDGRTSYTTVFHGLVGNFLLPKDIGSKIYIRSNGRVGMFNKNKVKMDMPEFEKAFDVESENAILAMQILTADVMAEMLDMYTKYKYRFEINILNDTVYMRLRTGSMFEPNVFGSSMDYKTIEKYYCVLKALTNIAQHVYDTISKLEI